jgi:hypothetical protein
MKPGLAISSLLVLFVALPPTVMAATLTWSSSQGNVTFTFDPPTEDASGDYWDLEYGPIGSGGEPTSVDAWTDPGSTITVAPIPGIVYDYIACWGSTNGTIDACAAGQSDGDFFLVVSNDTLTAQPSEAPRAPNADVAFDTSDATRGETRYIVVDADPGVTNITVEYEPEGTSQHAEGDYATFSHAYEALGPNLVHLRVANALGRHDYYYRLNVTSAPPNAARDPRFNDCAPTNGLCPSSRAPGGNIQYRDWFITPAQAWAWIVWIFFLLVATILGWIILVRTVS